MKSTIGETIPDTIPALEIFIAECQKEVNKFKKLMNIAQSKIDIKKGKIKTDYGFSNGREI